MPTVARYDGLADWYDAFATSEEGVGARRIALRLLGRGEGRLLDVGCGGGSHAAAAAKLGWRVTGVDVSDDQLQLASARGIEVVQAGAEALPFDEGTFDAALSMWTHTDIDRFGKAVAEVARVLRDGSPFVYLGVHPCFVGPHSRFLAGEGVPELHPGYRRTGRYTEAPGISPEGIRARVGASHLQLAPFLHAFLDAGFRLDRIEEPTTREYPYILASRWLRA